ncbi:MAG: rhodanese-related sulfurtransferase [Candidatus Babeliales bacterium]
MGTVLLYYSYVAIPYPKQIIKWQKKLCSTLNLRGRIRVAHEGISGTVGGSDLAINRYKKAMKESELFSNMDFNESRGDASCFPRITVVEKKEIVHLGIDPAELPAPQKGTYLAPDELHTVLSHKPNSVVLLDVRNNYESRIGTFQGAITPNIRNFRDLPRYIDTHLDLFKDKDVIMFCTGGVRCPRAVAYLAKKGVSKTVAQIKNGICHYTDHYPDGFFRGKNYVFDYRVALPINNDILTTCDLCPTPCDNYTNCLNGSCNKHFIACAHCLEAYQNSCSQQCLSLIREQKVKTRPPFPKMNFSL